MQSDRSVRVVTFNIGSGRDMEGHIDLPGTAELLGHAKADIIGLQEVDRHFSSRSHFADQVNWLAEQLDMYAAYGPNIDLPATEEGRPNRQYGNAVFSKHPIVSCQNHLLASVPNEQSGNEQRGVLETIINIEGTTIAFLNTHFSLDEQEQHLGVDTLIAITEQLEVPSIIVGDFNMTIDEPPMERLFSHFNPALPRNMHYPTTYSRDAEKGNRLDYILSDKHWSTKLVAVLPTDVSDHFPVLADMELILDLK
ncbi:endonuclease/exonuclease/phosphatase family protein [Planococcus salinus]|uniref:Endonuclease n=1 Tax=Planococcus salinus TaxID=1848460 RepID=A0A3M8P678_9BACL|nr:endonuclease/exonuclease/phosphatase family protein [Planococcus salinus]RNF38714.1 endonuclease [Planococcus salinus]